MGNDEALALFFTNMALRGKAPTTATNRRSMLRQLAAFLGDTPLLDASYADLLRWAESIVAQAPRTRYVKISTAHRFYTWAADEGHIADVPTRRLPRPKLPRLKPHPIAEESLTRALADASAEMRAWLCLGAYEGMRCCEIAPLQRAQILDTLDRPVIIPRGKGDKERIVPLGEQTLAALRPFLDRRGYLWQRRDGKPGPPTANRMSQMINKHLHDHGIAATAHSLRHRFATRVQEQSGDLQTTAELLGHSNVETARIYAEFSNRRAHAAIQALDASGW